MAKQKSIKNQLIDIKLNVISWVTKPELILAIILSCFIFGYGAGVLSLGCGGPRYYREVSHQGICYDSNDQETGPVWSIRGTPVETGQFFAVFVGGALVFIFGISTRVPERKVYLKALKRYLKRLRRKRYSTRRAILTLIVAAPCSVLAYLAARDSGVELWYQYQFLFVIIMTTIFVDYLMEKISSYMPILK